MKKQPTKKQETSPSPALPAAVHRLLTQLPPRGTSSRWALGTVLKTHEGTQQGGPGENVYISMFPSAALLHSISGFKMMTRGVILGAVNKGDER